MKTQAKITKKPAQGGKAKPGSAGAQSQAKSAQKLGNAQMGAADKSTNLKSGATIDGETKISKEAAAHPKSAICLTFDDGPASRVTEGVIAVLASEGVPATFFLNAVQGGKADADSEQQQHAFREIVANPLFQAGSHGYSHEVAGRVEYTERYAGIDPYKKDKKGKYVLDGKGRRIVDRSKIPKDDKLTFANDAKRDEFKKFLDDNNVHFRKVAENAANLKDTTDAQGAALKGWQGFKLVRLPGDGRFLINLKNEANKSNLKHVGWQFEIASGSLMRKRPGAKLDWLVKGVDAEPDPSHSKTVEGDVLPDSSVVVLLHDRHWKDTTKLRNIIQTLKKKGFAFGALDEAGSCIEVDSNRSNPSSAGKPVEPAPGKKQKAKIEKPAVRKEQLAPVKLRPMPLLEVGRIDDPAERDAEAVTDRVMRMRDGGTCCSACAAGSPCASHAPQIEHGQAMPLRRTVAGVGNSAGLPVPAGLEPQVRRATSGGEAIPATVRAFFEPRFGEDLSHVRIHRDADAAESTRALGAKAYTLGSHIAFSAGRWAPGTDAGDRLIAHELAHVGQQSRSVGAVQRKVARQPAATPTATPSVAVQKAADVLLGERLLTDFQSGVAIAFYAPMPDQHEEAKNAATKWAARESALGLKDKTVTAANVIFGSALADEAYPLVETLRALGPMLTKATAKARPASADQPLPGTGPATVRTLAVFAHGTSDWCGLGAIRSSTAASIIKSIAPQLASNVTVVLYSCNAGREPDTSEDWVKGTMQSGGAGSLASKARDALAAHGKSSGTVWGHTTTGHVTENYALREFSVIDGVGTEGASFVSKYVFEKEDSAITAGDLLDGVNTLGFRLTKENAGKKIIEAAVTKAMYDCNAMANAKLTFRDGAKLAEAAPVHPVEVGKQIKDYWTTMYWPNHKGKAAAKLLKELKDAKKVKKN